MGSAVEKLPGFGVFYVEEEVCKHTCLRVFFCPSELGDVVKSEEGVRFLFQKAIQSLKVFLLIEHKRFKVADRGI